MQGDHVLHFDGHAAVGLYDYRQDRLLKENLLGQRPQVEREMQTLLEAVIQQYANRMVDNRLTVR